MKKIITCVVLIATLITLLAVPVSAEKIFFHDFENPPASGNLSDVGDGNTWKPYTTGMEGVVSFEDGAVKIDYASTGRPFWNVHYNVPGQDHVLVFDFMTENQSAQLSIQHFLGGTRVINKSFPYASAASTWRTVMIVVSNGATKSEVYYKDRDAKSDTWTKMDVVNTTNNTDGTRGAHERTDFKLGFDSSSNPSKTGAIWYDNYMVYDGLWFDNMNVSLENAAVEEIADVISGGTMVFDFDVYDADIQFASDMTIAENDTTVKLIAVALDKEMKMIGCNTKNYTLKGNKNSFSVELDLSDDENDMNYYGKLKDGGQINFYAWNNMQPLCEPIVID